VGNNPINKIDPSGLAGQPAPFGPPPVPVPGGKGIGWKWNSNAQNARGGSYGPEKPLPDQSQPSASLDPEGHWDIDDGLGNRQRYDLKGKPITPEEAHGKSSNKTPNTKSEMSTLDKIIDWFSWHFLESGRYPIYADENGYYIIRKNGKVQQIPPPREPLPGFDGMIAPIAINPVYPFPAGAPVGIPVPVPVMP
jgi:hypothetical protein